MDGHDNAFSELSDPDGSLKKLSRHYHYWRLSVAICLLRGPASCRKTGSGPRLGIDPERSVPTSTFVIFC